MRTTVLAAAAVSLLSASSTSAGFLDRLRGQAASSISASVVSAVSPGVLRPSPATVAPPQTPAEPSVDDAFGGAAVPTGQPEAASPQAGSGKGRSASVAETGDVKTQVNDPLRLPGVKDRFAEPFDGYELKWKFLTVRHDRRRSALRSKECSLASARARALSPGRRADFFARSSALGNSSLKASVCGFRQAMRLCMPR